MYSEFLRGALTDDCKNVFVAGSKPGKNLTPFTLTVKRWVDYLKEHDGCTIDELIADVVNHYHTDRSAKNSIMKYIRTGVITEFTVIDKSVFLKKECEK